MNTQYRKNLKAVAQACKDYTDEKIKKVYYDIGHNDITTDDHINEPTYHFTAPANAKLLMLQSIAGNSNKIAPSTPSDDSVARIKTIPDNTYKSQVDYIGGKSVKYNQLVSVQSGTKNITAPYGIIYSFVTVDFTHKYFLNAKHSVSFDNLNINFYVAGSGNVRNQQLVGSTSIQAILNPNYNAIGNINCYCANSTDITVSYDSLELIDLTDIFGAGNEPSTVETAIPLLKANGYKLDGTDEYSTGSLKHAIVSGVKYEGNLFDGTASNGSIRATDGDVGGDANLCYSDYIEIKSNTHYYNNITIQNYITSGLAFYDSNKTFISGIVNNSANYNSFISPSNAKYIRFTMTIAEKNNVEFYEYAPITKAIPSEVLALELNKSAGSVYDVIDCNNKAGTRKVGAYTFTGNETWVKFSNGRYYFEGFKTLIKASTLNIETTTNLTVMSSSEIYSQDNGIAVGSDGTLLIKNTTSITSTSEAQSYMAGKTIQYELKDYVPYDLSQYFNDGWNKVDLDKQYATCEMVVAEPIDMPNKVEYYGTIIHSLATAVKQDGFNVWDEEWEVGEIADATGQNVSSSSVIRSKNYISVMPNSILYFKTPQTMTVYQYDSNKNFLGQAYNFYGSNNTKTLESNCAYIRFKLVSTYGTTYNNDICINISNQDLNGTYKPYKAPITRLLPNSEAKYSWGITNGVRNIRVFCDDEGNAVNEGSLVVGNNDLGELNDWEIRSGETNLFQSGALRNVIKKTTDNDQVANALCDIYSIDTTNNVLAHTSNTIAVFPSGYIGVYDSLFTNATIFKTAMNGVPLFYQKNTTDTETLDDFDYFFDCEEGDTFTIIGCELLQCYATYSFLIKEAKSNE